MTEPRPEDDQTQPIDKAAEHTAPMDPFSDDDDDLGPHAGRDHGPEAGNDLGPEAGRDLGPDAGDNLGPDAGDETVIQDATRVIPPATGAPAWAGRAGVPVPPPSERLRDSAPYPTGEPQQPRTWWTPILLGVLALALFGVIILVAWLMSRDTTTEPTNTPTPTLGPITATASLVPTTAAPSPSASPAVQLVQVPANLVGMTQDDAVTELNKLGLSYVFEFQESAAPQDEVIATRPAAQALVPAGSTVTLVISKGGRTSPSPSPSTSPSP